MTLLLLLWVILTGPASPRVAPPEADFAHEVLGEVAPTYFVLAARRWHGGTGGWGCTFAVVSIPGREPMRHGRPTWRLDRFGGAWQAGPLPPPRDAQRDALASCEGEWPPALASRIRSAAADPTGWWARDEAGEAVSLYSPDARIVAWVRYGD